WDGAGLQSDRMSIMATHDELFRVAAVQTWQLAAVVLVIGTIVRFIARNRPYLAHLLWMLVIAKCLTPPVWSSPSGLFCWLQSGYTAPTPIAAPVEASSDRPDISDLAIASEQRETENLLRQDELGAEEIHHSRFDPRAFWRMLSSGNWKLLAIRIWFAG